MSHSSNLRPTKVDLLQDKKSLWSFIVILVVTAETGSGGGAANVGFCGSPGMEVWIDAHISFWMAPMDIAHTCLAIWSWRCGYEDNVLLTADRQTRPEDYFLSSIGR